MSKLDELIEEMCPNGVEYKPLGDLCYLVTKQTGFDYSNHIKARLLNHKEDGAIPYMQTKFFTGHRFDYNTDYYVPRDIVEKFPKITLNERCLLFSIVGASIGNVGLFPAKQMCFLGGAICVAKVKPEYCVDFLYYCVESHDFQRQIVQKTKGPQATITVDDIRNFVVPVPPLEVQREIVRVLDNFTFLTAELTAELTARKKQYEYYREQLLSADTEIERFTIDECTQKTQNIKWKDTVGEYDYIDLSSVDREMSAICETTTINSNSAPSRAQQIVHTDDVLFGTTRPLLKRCCMVPQKYDGQIASTGFCILRAQKEKILPRYLYYVISSDAFYKYLEPLQVEGSYPSVTNSNVKAYSVSLPSIAVQTRIVRVLDNFEVICNNLKIGLPAEIEARRKQYEFYRDKLLTFKEKQFDCCGEMDY